MKKALPLIIATCLTLPLSAFGDGSPFEIRVFVYNKSNKPITITSNSHPNQDTYYYLYSDFQWARRKLPNGKPDMRNMTYTDVLKPGEFLVSEFHSRMGSTDKPSIQDSLMFFSVYGYTMALVHNTATANWQTPSNSNWKNIQWKDDDENYYGFNLTYNNYNQGFQFYDADPNSGQSPQPGCSTEVLPDGDLHWYRIKCYITNDSIRNNLPE